MNKAALRIGLMVPANNTTMEAELLAWLPQGATCRTLRIPRRQGLLAVADPLGRRAAGAGIQASGVVFYQGNRLEGVQCPRRSLE